MGSVMQPLCTRSSPARLRRGWVELWASVSRWAERERKREKDEATKCGRIGRLMRPTKDFRSAEVRATRYYFPTIAAFQEEG